MFQRIHSLLVKDENGISLQSTGQFQLTYKEGSRTMLLKREVGTGKSGEHMAFISFHKWLRWEKPHETEVIEIEHLERIKSNIREAMQVLVTNARVEFDETVY